MQIPSHLPDLNVPLIQRQDSAPASPVVPVAGVPELAQVLDSRVALQWTQPILSAEQGQYTKSTTETLLPPKAVPVSAVLLELDAPLGAGKQPTQVGRWLSVLAARQDGQAAVWPAVPSALAQASPPDVGVLQAMDRVYAALAQSPMFAASRLAAQIQKHKPTAERMSSKALDMPLPATGDDVAAFVQNVAALSLDSPEAQLAAQCLTTGSMVWNGQLVPNLPVQIRREDAWRENPQAPGQLEKGVSLMLETELPHVGQLKIVAQQWGADRSVTVYVHHTAGVPLKAQAGDMQAQLQALGVVDARVQEMDS